MARKRRMRKLAAKRAAEKVKAEVKAAPKKEVVKEPVVEAAPEPAPVAIAAEGPAVEEKPKRTRRSWARKTTTEE